MATYEILIHMLSALSIRIHHFLLDKFQILPHTDAPKSYPGTVAIILRIEHTVCPR